MHMMKRLWVSILLIGGLPATVGCQAPLFPENIEEPRTPYSRYETLRGKDRPRNEMNVYGREQPALRKRLSPLGT